MKSYARHILTIFFLLAGASMLLAQDNIVTRVDSLGQEVEEEAQAFNPKETIFEHLGDEYGWKIVGRVTLPLPVIVGERTEVGTCSVPAARRTGRSTRGSILPVAGITRGKWSARMPRGTSIARMTSRSRRTCSRS